MPLPTLAVIFTLTLCVATGLSHLLHPKPWTDLFRDLLTRPYAGLVIGLLTLQTGLFILLAHWSWEIRTGLIVTLLGCAWTFKGTLYLLHPTLVHRVAAPHLARPNRFRIAGAAMLLIAAAIALDLR